MFKNLFGLVEDTVKIAVAPIEIGAALVRPITKPIADTTEEVADILSENIDDLDK